MMRFEAARAKGLRPDRTAARASGAPAARWQRARRLARWRRLTGAILLSAPALLAVAFDASRRGTRLTHLDWYHRATYLGAFVESLVVWGLLLYAASRRRGSTRIALGALFLFMLTFAVGGQRYFHEQYNAYLNVDVSRFASNFADSVVNQLFADFANYLSAKLPVLCVAAGLLWAASKWVRPRRRPAQVAQVAAPLVLIGAFFVPTQHRHVQASTPDMLYLNAIGGLLRTQLGLTEQSNQLRPRARRSLPVVLEEPRDAKRPNILLVILESVRADAVCTDFVPSCKRTPYSNRIVPERFPLRQMRAQASSTAISLAVLWAGVGPHESRDVLHTWPLIFDYARAAGYDTAFWTSQNMMFGNARLWVKNLGVSQFVSATELDPEADLDMGAPEHLLATHVNEHIGELREPFLAVVQLSNVHYPYLVDEDEPMPFQPATTSKAPESNQEFFNLYLNSVHQQDVHVARMLRRVRESALGDDTVIVYTSDHGEAFREHNQMGHTFSVLDEEIHVPAWIDAPPGLLSDSERESLRDKVDAFTYHSDITATILDLMGVYDDPGIERYKTKMLGKSLIRPGDNRRMQPLTNCAGVWSCAFENWGVMRENMKLEARAWDPEWHCYDLEADPYEGHNLGEAACPELKARALSLFERLPGRRDDE